MSSTVIVGLIVFILHLYKLETTLDSRFLRTQDSKDKEM